GVMWTTSPLAGAGCGAGGFGAGGGAGAGTGPGCGTLGRVVVATMTLTLVLLTSSVTVPAWNAMASWRSAPGASSLSIQIAFVPWVNGCGLPPMILASTGISSSMRTWWAATAPTLRTT